MTTARSQLICPDITPYYHCVSRCVRRSFLCGKDTFSGQSYEHRRDWVEQRILSLAQIYCIDIYAYAVMSNHYHLVAHIDQNTAHHLSHQAVIERWCSEHQMPPLIQRYISDQLISESEKNKCYQQIEIWRQRLCSLSWFMKELNYDIAVQANKEDGCTGRFWEGRFKSQALLDENALLGAILYVDLNPIRAKMADTPEQSDYTSIQKRLKALTTGKNITPLSEFTGHQNTQNTKGIPFRLMDYLELIDWAGRHIREEKIGHIDIHQPPLLQRIQLSGQDCLMLCNDLEKKSRLWIGSCHHVHRAKTHLSRKRMVAIHIA